MQNMPSIRDNMRLRNVRIRNKFKNRRVIPVNLLLEITMILFYENCIIVVLVEHGTRVV